MHLGSFPQELEAQLRRARRVLLIGHQNPDADSLGSLTAFSHYADGFSGAIDMFYEPPFPPRLRFLPGVTRFQPVMNGPYDLAIVFDCGDLLHARLTRERLEELGAPLVVNIDHHQTNANFGDLNLVAPHAASTTEILYHYFRALGVFITPELATSILAGILGDTGGFHYANTSPAALAAAADLVAHGASLPKLYDITLKDKNVAALQRWGHVLSRIAVSPAYGVATVVISRSDLAGLADERTAASGLANFLNGLAGVRAVLVLVEQDDLTIRGSLRSRDPLLDVSKFATLLGGGGHKLAAGFTVKGKFEETAKGWRIIEVKNY